MMQNRMAFVLNSCLAFCGAFQSINSNRHDFLSSLSAVRFSEIHDNVDTLGGSGDRRHFLQDTTRLVTSNAGLVALLSFSSSPLLQQVQPAHAGEFTPGGTLVDRAVGVSVGNSQASTSRKVDNSNVLFVQDYYFKFGTAAQWIAPDSTDFPATTMPFVRVQQRYDGLKKYGERITRGLAEIAALKQIEVKLLSDIANPVAADVYQLRPMGLLANTFLASENTGTTNELLLARWYINEMYLLINDMRNAPSVDVAQEQVYPALCSAVNSYLTLMNRVITSKVGDKFSYLS
jgi:hypothetical protein